ncbi:MAG: UDP-3-O-acyl-N-acetylglucosamine deacetylase [Candidatus Eremiobacteraeota bacterium]|nr:UDP-3-O-acyl-N-acetylglucosamine deacetylase [Candidatus Eremiobacteraeota bacterium]
MGLHTGELSRIRVEPSCIDGRIVFHGEGKDIPALVENVISTKRCTTLGKDGVKIHTVEHLLSLCYAMGIDNLNIYFESNELPILDGSCKDLAIAFQSAGIKVLDALKKVIAIDREISIVDGDSIITGMPSANFSIGCMIDYNHPVVGVQTLFYRDDNDDFLQNFAPARTFGFWEEIEKLREIDLARGGSLDNALVIKKDGYMMPPRFPDEIVRHKILDMLGDMSLSGAQIQGHIFAIKPSHKLNVQFVKEMVSIQSSPK